MRDADAVFRCVSELPAKLRAPDTHEEHGQQVVKAEHRVKKAALKTAQCARAGMGMGGGTKPAGPEENEARV